MGGTTLYNVVRSWVMGSKSVVRSWVMGSKSVVQRCMAHGSWGFCHDVWPMGHGEKVAEGAQPPIRALRPCTCPRGSSGTSTLRGNWTRGRLFGRWSFPSSAISRRLSTSVVGFTPRVRVRSRALLNEGNIELVGGGGGREVGEAKNPRSAGPEANWRVDGPG